MSRLAFLILLTVITFTGLLLRLIDYDRVPPFGVTQDEFAYPWAGMSLIQTGIPTSWSWFGSYPKRDIVVYWEATYPLVSPWLEKPPLYSLIAGGWVLANGAKDLFDVRLSVLRVLPITISFFTIILVGLLAKNFFGEKVALISTILYATVPTIVMSNRLSLVENLLTPIVLAALYLFPSRIFLIAFLCALAVLTKNIGIVLPLMLILILITQRKWRDILIIGTLVFLSALVHPLMGAYYNWNLFINVIAQYQEIHALSGFPELVSTIFRFPIVGHQWDKIFPEGPMLAGYILLFSSPFWLKAKNSLPFLLFPLAYVLVLALLESGGTLYSYFGWHVYPLFPFMMILLAKVLYDFWQDPEAFKSIFFYLLIGFSTVRLFIMIAPNLLNTWQLPLFLLSVVFLSSFLLKLKLRRILFLGLFLVFLFINFLVIASLNRIYPGFPQPIN